MLYIYGEIRCFSYKYTYNKVELQIFFKKYTTLGGVGSIHRDDKREPIRRVSALSFILITDVTNSCVVTSD